MGLLIARASPQATIVVPRSYALEAARALAESGFFHPSEAGDESIRGILRRARGEVELLIQRIRSLLDKIGIEGEVEKLYLQISSNISAASSSIVATTSRFVEEIENRIASLIEVKTDKSLAEYIDLVSAYSFIEADLGFLRSAKYLRVLVLHTPREDADKISREVSHAGGLTRVFDVDEETVSLIVLYTPDLEETIERIISASKATPIILPKTKITKDDLGKFSSELKEALLKLEALSSLIHVLESVKFTRNLAIFTGYIADEGYDVVEKKLKEALGNYYVISSARGSSGLAKIPVEFRAPRLLKPFEELVKMYGFPSPGEFIPLLLMAITFPIIFGLMFPDLGHGLLLLIGGIYLSKKAKSEGWRTIGSLLIYISIPAMFFGFLASEFFGPATPVAGWIEHEVWHGHPLYSSPVHAIYTAMKTGETEAGLVRIATFKVIHISLFIGAALLTMASYIGVIRTFKFREYEQGLHMLGVASAFTGVLLIFLYLSYTGIDYANYMDQFISVLGSSSISNVIIGLIVMGLVFGLLAPILFGHESIGQRIMLGAVEAFDVFLVLLGNTLSFVRIMGLMLAHSGLVFGFYVIAVQAIGGGKPLVVDTIPEIAVYAFGNLFVAVFEAMVASIHTLRLHLYEMFTKFYLGGGIPYTPVKMPPLVTLKIRSR